MVETLNNVYLHGRPPNIHLKVEILRNVYPHSHLLIYTPLLSSSSMYFLLFVGDSADGATKLAGAVTEWIATVRIGY